MRRRFVYLALLSLVALFLNKLHGLLLDRRVYVIESIVDPHSGRARVHFLKRLRLRFITILRTSHLIIDLGEALRGPKRFHLPLSQFGLSRGHRRRTFILVEASSRSCGASFDLSGLVLPFLVCFVLAASFALLLLIVVIIFFVSVLETALLDVSEQAKGCVESVTAESHLFYDLRTHAAFDAAGSCRLVKHDLGLLGAGSLFRGLGIGV